MAITIEVPDEYEDGAITALEEMLFDVEVVDNERYRITNHDA